MKKMSSYKKAIFLRQLSLIYNSDVMSSDGIEMLKKNEKDEELLSFYDELSNSLLMGMPLSESIKNSSNIFEEHELCLIELGERSGNISTVLSDMAENIEQAIVLDSKIKSAFRYPAVLASLTFCIMLLILVFIVPTYYNLIKSSGAEATVIMKFLNSTAIFIKEQYIILFVLVFSLFALNLGLKKFIASKGKDKEFNEKYTLKGILTKDIRLQNSALEFTRNLAMLLDSGIDNLSAFEILERAESQDEVKSEIQKAIKELKESGDFAEAMQSFTIFPDIINELLSVATNTGHIVPSLKRAQSLMFIELNKKIDKLVSMIEPVITIIITSIVGIILISGVYPIFKILDFMV